MKAQFLKVSPLFAALLSMALVPGAGCDSNNDESQAANTRTEPAHQVDRIDLDIGTALANVEGVSDFEEVESEDPQLRIFHFTLEQPVFHGDETSETFKQRLILIYRSSLAPTVLRTLGYNLQEGKKPSRFAAPLSANELLVEHRYFGGSKPATNDYKGLLIQESASDLHRVVQSFRPLLWGSWISAGTSKGGMTALYHRRFYPFDTQATLAYVAPNSYGKKDRKYREFFDQVGTKACRDKILAYQKQLLARKDELMATIPELDIYKGFTYELMPGGLSEVVERAVHEMEFALWQYQGDVHLANNCEQVPGADADAEQMLRFRPFRIGVILNSDALMRSFVPYYAQTQTEIGFPVWTHPELASLYTVDVEDMSPFLLGAKLPPFDPSAMLDIGFWTSVAMNRSIMLYGGLDPFTIRAFKLSSPRIGESYVLTAPQGTHSMGLEDLPEPAKTTALDAIKRWTGAEWTPPTSVDLASRYGNIDEDPQAMLEYLLDVGPQ